MCEIKEEGKVSDLKNTLPLIFKNSVSILQDAIQIEILFMEVRLPKDKVFHS